MLSSLYPRNGIWYIEFSRSGKRVRRSLNTRDLSIARRVQRKFNREGTLDEFGLGEERREPLCTVVEFEERYFRWVVDHKRPKTGEMDRLAWRQFREVWRGQVLSDISIGDLERFKTHLLGKGHRPISVNRKLGHLSAVLGQAVRWELLEVNPVGKVDRYRVDREAPVWLSPGEARRVLEISSHAGRNIHLIFALGLGAGLRKAEILSSRWDWFDFERLVISLRSGEGFKLKGGEDRTVPLQSGLAEVLGMYRERGGFVFSGNGVPYRIDPRTAVGRVYEEAGLEPVRVYHTLRHTFASLLVMAGVSLFKVSQWLGHKDISTTQIYAHLAPRDEDIERLDVFGEG